jgi:hypothetical protein
MSSDDASIVTCECFVKDVPRTKSYPVKALEKHVELDLEQLADKSADELAKLYHDLVSGKASLTQTSKETVLAVGDIVSLKSDGPLMTVVSTGARNGED